MPTALRVLTWNLFHGRSVPPAGRDLHDDFSGLLCAWEWDVALLQEVPPWWGPTLVPDAHSAVAQTSRNSLGWLRRSIARRWPDLIKSNGGGANIILSRIGFSEHLVHKVRWLPERRVVHAVRLPDGTWVANVHCSVPKTGHAQEDLERSLSALNDWAGGAPAILGGDFNLRMPVAPGFESVASGRIDHIVARSATVLGTTPPLETTPLSDHPALIVSLSVTTETAAQP